MKHLFIIILGITLICSCSEPVTFENFSQENWKKDNLGCEGLREKEVKHFKEIKAAIQGVGETDILGILGRPNRHVLGTRMKKNYFYFVEATCKDLKTTPQSWLEVKFNSVSQVEEVVYKTVDGNNY